MIAERCRPRRRFRPPRRIAAFFFSRRRRHTMCLSDWSSDVCSSDLKTKAASAKVTSPGVADSNLLPRGTPWPSTTTIHFVPLPFLVFPTQAPLFLPERNCHQETRSEERRVGKDCESSSSAYIVVIVA